MLQPIPALDANSVLIPSGTSYEDSGHFSPALVTFSGPRHFQDINLELHFGFRTPTNPMATLTALHHLLCSVAVILGTIDVQSIYYIAEEYKDSQN